MPGRHQAAPSRRPALLGWAFAALTALAVLLGASTLFGTAAGASDSVKAQLTLTGLATANNPVGGSQIGIHPGDSVVISPSTAPTAGLDKLGLGDLLGGLLNGVAGIQMKADFSKLPGGKANTVIGANTKPVTFSFPHADTYQFTWTAQQIGLLGGTVPIKLDGNQLQQAGVKLNAQNQYVGKIVVAKNPPKGGISVQLPGASVAPNVGGHQLPTLGVPGVNAPTLGVTVPDLPNLPGLPGGGKKTTAPAGGKKTTTPPAAGGQLPVPALIVPDGAGGPVFGGAGGYLSGVLPGSLGSGTGSSNLLPIAGGGAKTSAAPALHQDSTGKDKTIDLAASKGDSTGQFSVILAIVAIIALSVVAATYARLYLLRRETPTS